MSKTGLINCLTLTLTLTLSACSTINKMAINGSSNLLYSAGGNVETQNNFEFVKSGMSGNLLLMESLLSASPENQNIIATLNKGYAGLAFAINETQMNEEEWAELKSEEGRKQALFNYTRALTYGQKYLAEEGVEFSELINRINEPQEIHHLLDKRLSNDKRDLEVILFTAQSFGALINLQKDNMTLVAQLPVAKTLFDWVCAKNPQINYGTCDIFYGAFEAGRPQMLGGNPKKGKEIFLKAIQKHPHNWLIRTSFIQYYLIPQNDEEGFKEQMNFLATVHEAFNKYYIYDAAPKADAEWTREENLRLYQSIAMKRYELLNRFQKQFF